MAAAVLAMTPFAADGNYGAALNAALDLLPEDAWACIVDHDAMFTTPHWHAQLTEAIAAAPQAGAFVACTNRAARAWQRAGDAAINDIAWHRRFGLERAKLRTLLDVSDTRGWAGVCFAVSKAAWRAAGGFADGLGCVDHSLHYGLRRIGRPVYLLEGLYVFHWRHHLEPDPTTRFPKAPGCPCLRAPDVTPAQRIALPSLAA